jgi:hypothetical protein
MPKIEKKQSGAPFIVQPSVDRAATQVRASIPDAATE